MLKGRTVSGKPGQGERNADGIVEAGQGGITVSRYSQYLIKHSSHCSDAPDEHRPQGFYVLSLQDGGGHGRRRCFGPFRSAAIAEKIITSAHYLSAHGGGEGVPSQSVLRAATAGDGESAQLDLCRGQHVL